MKMHEGSEWHKLARAKVEAERQTETQGTVVFQLQQAKLRDDELMKQRNRILIQKLLRIMYFLCKQKIAHFTNFTDVVQLMVENGDTEVKKHCTKKCQLLLSCGYK